MAYDPAGRQTALINASGRRTSVGYEQDRLTKLEHFQNGATIARSGYAYSADGSLEIDRDLETPAQSETLAYDPNNRLVMVSEGVPATDGGTPNPVEDYAYDPNGNRTSSHLSATYQVDDHNRLLEDGSFTYGYDVKGNRTSRTDKVSGDVQTYAYDSTNQLVSVSENGTLVATYAYDALGRRIAKTTGGVTTAWVYDIGNLHDVTTHDRLLEFENGILTKRWLHGQRVDESLGFEAYTTDSTPGAGNVYALHADRQGSVIAVTDQASGTLAARYRYDAFGQREEVLANVTQDVGFTGREYDSESGLYYYRARHYDPFAGRFLQSDPLGFAAGDVNLYAYTWNDPANWTDPSGLSPTASFARLTAKAAELYMGPFGHVAEGTLCLANKISTALQDIGNRLEEGRDISEVELHAVGCIVRAVAPLPCRCQGSGGRGGPRGKNSFPEGTEVLTPQGKVAIEDLREGDLVIARDEETGVSGVFPVVAVMGRVAPEVLWLTLEDQEGQTTRMGVTSEHPLFTAGQGWLTAGELAAGDRIRNANLHDLTVLSVELDQTPQRVHNLEIAEAHTCFVGDLEAWGHNSRSGGAGDPIPCESFEEALSKALDFIKNESGAPFKNTGTGSSKWGHGTTMTGENGTSIRIESDGKHGNHVNATCHNAKGIFTFIGGLPSWAKRGG